MDKWDILRSKIQSRINFISSMSDMEQFSATLKERDNVVKNTLFAVLDMMNELEQKEKSERIWSVDNG